MNIGILLWNRCNASCLHCAPSSGPEQSPELTDAQIFATIDAAFHDSPAPKIGLSGGEAFLYFERLCTIVEYATSKGASVSVNTNGSWAVTEKKAKEKLARLKSIGLSRIVISADEFHQEFIKVRSVLNAVRACKAVHLEVELQFVATRKTSRLSDFLARYGDDFINVRCREIPCHPVGRAEQHVSETDLFVRSGIPDGLCPSAILSLSADGRFMPCCNTAGDLPSLQVGRVEENAVDVCSRFKSSALLQTLVSEGPKSFVPIAEAHGFAAKPGYVDQCHLCYDLFKDEERARVLRSFAIDKASEKLCDKVMASLKGPAEYANQ